MPTYDYQCSGCDHTFEAFHQMSKRLRKCPKCGKLSLTRLIGKGAGVRFIGPGFYANDYKKHQK